MRTAKNISGGKVLWAAEVRSIIINFLVGVERKWNSNISGDTRQDGIKEALIIQIH